MELPVLQSRESETELPWYGGGLRFTCTQCGNCCTGGPGYVWISNVEIQRLADHLKLTTRQVIRKYLRKIGSRYSLKENRNARGEYDCIFLTEEKRAPRNGEQIVYTKRGCSIYPVRPLQCRTWPFWDGNLISPEAWRNSSERCHGMNNGSRVFSMKEIESLRDAQDWPVKPPTSG
jgi:Fe-S-cluster containining protein